MLLKIPQSRFSTALLFLIVSLLTRFPYFFKASVDWDEHTFILLGQSVLDGHLPYTFLLDVKPPGLWYCFGLLAFLAQYSLFKLRLLGSLLVATLAFLCYLNASHHRDQRTGVVAGLVLIALLNLSNGGQAVMSEHLAMLPIALAFTLLTCHTYTARNLFLIGILLAIAPLIRLNLAYCSGVIGLYLTGVILLKSQQSWPTRILHFTAFGLGSISVLTALLIPYWLQGELGDLNRGMIQASLSYSNQQDSPLKVVGKHLYYLFLTSKDSIALLILHWFLAINVVKNVRGYVKQGSQRGLRPGTGEHRIEDEIGEGSIWARLDRHTLIILLFLTSIELSIVQTGAFYGHYNIQLAFFISLLTADPIAPTLTPNQQQKRWLLGIVTAVFIIHHLTQYTVVVTKLIQTGSPTYGLAFEVSKVLEQENPDRQPVWLQTYPLAYWLTHTYPVIPSLTHPSNLYKEFLLQAWYGAQASTALELHKITVHKPLLIVDWEDRTNLFPEAVPVHDLLPSWIDQHYQVLDNYDPKLLVYRRRDG